MDWGLGNFKCEFPLLRKSDTLTFPPYVYYSAILINGIFRLGWAIYISPGNMVLQQHFILLLGCVELLRRFIWSIFRVEWESVVMHSEESVERRRQERLAQHLHHHSNSVESFFLAENDSDDEDGDVENGRSRSSSEHVQYTTSIYQVELGIPDDDQSTPGDISATPSFGEMPYQASSFSAYRNPNDGIDADDSDEDMSDREPIFAHSKNHHATPSDGHAIKSSMRRTSSN